MSMIWSEATARETIWRMAWSRSSDGWRSPIAPLARTARTAWKKATSSMIPIASSDGTANANARDSEYTASCSRDFPSR